MQIKGKFKPLLNDIKINSDIWVQNNTEKAVIQLIKERGS